MSKRFSKLKDNNLPYPQGNNSNMGNYKDLAAFEQKFSGMYLLKRLLFEYIKPHRKRIFFAVLCMILVAAATATNAWMMQPVLDQIFLNKDRHMLFIIPAAVLGIAILKGLGNYGQSVIMKYVGQRIVTDMQLSLYQHLLHADISLFQAQSSGKLLSRFTNDIMLIRRTASTFFVSVAKEFFTLIFLVGVMLYQSVTLSIIALLVLPLAIYPLVRTSKRMRKISSKTQEELGHYTSTLDDAFQSIRMVKAYGRENYEITRAKNVMEGIFNLYFKAARIESISSPMMEILSSLAIAGVIGYGGMQVIGGSTTPGAFFSFIAALLMAYRPMRSLSGLGTSLQEGLAASNRFFNMLAIKPRITELPNAKPLARTISEIKFTNVTFHYTTLPALNMMNLTVPTGKRIALVGESGSGKSTVMNMLLRFYDPNDGIITINGQDIRSYTIESLRNNIAIVNQEATLFDDTIRANILYGKPDASEDEMITAAYSAAAHDFISTLPMGYDTLVGQNGIRLSGGQRQRIAIARAMLRDAPILLLDEATSSLDPISEHQVQLALDRLMKGRTTIVIAHRLSTIMNADIIYVLSAGTVIESGTHNELLKKGGEYSKHYERQFAHMARNA